MLNESMYKLGSRASAIREIFEYSCRRKKEVGNENVFDFSLGNPCIPPPAIVTDTIIRLIRESNPVNLHGYTSAFGDSYVRTKIAESIEKKLGVSTDPSLIYMTCGAAASLTITLKALLNKGDEVILPAPYFPEYKVFVENADGSPIEVLRKSDDFQLDIVAIEGAITKKTSAIILNSPNNPTGTVFSESSIKKLASLLEKKSIEFGRRIYIISDEPYRELVYDGSIVTSVPKMYKHTIVCYSFSKSLSLPGERIGYIFVPPELDDAKRLFTTICGAGRSLGFVCAPSLLQYTVAECCDALPDICQYDRNRTFLYKALTHIGYECVSPNGAFYLFVKSLESDALKFCEKAKKLDLMLVPSNDFGYSGYVRISYCVDYRQIKRSISVFEKLYRIYRK